jgi:uncharacterized protein (TIGR02145 family)
MKNLLPLCMVLATTILTSCDRSLDSGDASGTRAISARVSRATDVTNSIWTRTKSVHVRLLTNAKDTLQDTTVSFSGAAAPAVLAPVGDSVFVSILGSDGDTALWSGSDTILPGSGNVVDSIWVHLATLPGPHLDSTSVAAWGTDTFDQSVRVYLSLPVLSKLVTGASIRYTLDGTDPTSSSPVYDDAGIPVDSSLTLKAVAFDTLSGISQTGAVLRRRIVLQTRPVQFAASSLWAPFKVALASSTTGTTIHYTIDGTTPTAASPTYTDSLVFAKYGDSLVVKAFAVSSNPKVARSVADSFLVGTTAPWRRTDSIAYGTLTDSRDGQSYRTVTVGTQKWMAENLNYASDSSFCYAADTANCTRYGRLYRWSAASGLSASYDTTFSGAVGPGVCPSGWHLPSESEWNTLTDYVDSSVSARSLRSRGPIWSGKGSDTYGFRAIPGGNRYSDGSFDLLENAAYFWTSTEYSAYGARYRSLSINALPATANGDLKTRAFSVRCIAN